MLFLVVIFLELLLITLGLVVHYTLTLDDGQTAVYAHLSKFSPQLEDRLKLEQEVKRSYITNIFLSPEEFKFEKGDIIGYSGKYRIFIWASSSF